MTIKKRKNCNFNLFTFKALDDVWVNKISHMDTEIVVAMQRFCDLFDRDRTSPDNMIIINYL